MKTLQTENHYRKFYESIGFERTGLFECLRNEFGDRKVLYLGSSAHIAPSFVFSNVTYVDNSETTKAFFHDEDAIVKLVERKKAYRRKPRIKYVNADYTKDALHGEFNLILAIFSPGTLNAARQFVGDNSLLVYLPLPAENQTNIGDNAFKVIGAIRMKGGKYQYSPGAQKNVQQKKDMIEGKFRDVYVYSVLTRR